MSRGEEITRLGLRRIIDQAEGKSRSDTRTGAMRQADISIINRLMLPVRTVPGGSTGAVADAPSSSPLQVGAAFRVLAGYSAAPGSPAAAADATGRGGDTVVTAHLSARGSSKGTAALEVAFPLTASATAGSTGTIAITIV